MVYVCRMERRIDVMREVARPKGIQSIGSGQICRGCKLNRQGTGFCLVGHLCFEEAQPINQGSQVNPIYGIELPKNVERALEIDRESGTDFWAKALQLEMSKIFPAVKILDEGAPQPVGHEIIPCHIVFDVKMDFTRKARYVAGGHKTGEPETRTYASVVSRESVRIGFMLAALNGVDVTAADIAVAYLNAPCHEKICTRCGLEFGKEYEGRFAIITKALYGLKTRAFAWREHLSTTLQESLGFKPCKADPDVYLQPAKKQDGSAYYELVFIYIDDVLVISDRG